MSLPQYDPYQEGAEPMTTDIRARFTSDTADHVMTVLHDDGLYRHLRFMAEVWRPPLLNPQRSSLYWFDLITVPGALIFQGDGESYTFRRVEDMFEFFRGPVGRVNPGYWAEKLTDGCDRVMEYDREIFETQVKAAFVDAVRGRAAPAGLGRAVREEILDSDEVNSDEGAHRVLNNFSFYKPGTARRGAFRRVDGVMTWVPPAAPDFEFTDTWEWDFRDYDWWFLWALHAIVWGIAQYDTLHGNVLVDTGVPASPAASHRRPREAATLQTAGERL